MHRHKRAILRDERFSRQQEDLRTASAEGCRRLQAESLVRAGQANSRLENLRYDEVGTFD